MHPQTHSGSNITVNCRHFAPTDMSRFCVVLACSMFFVTLTTPWIHRMHNIMCVCVCMYVCMYVCRISLLTWQESWPPFSCPAHRKISGMNSCLPARRNMDLQQSLLTIGTDTCIHYSSLLHQFSTGTYCC